MGRRSRRWHRHHARGRGYLHGLFSPPVLDEDEDEDGLCGPGSAFAFDAVCHRNAKGRGSRRQDVLHPGIARRAKNPAAPPARSYLIFHAHRDDNYRAICLTQPLAAGMAGRALRGHAPRRVPRRWRRECSRRPTGGSAGSAAVDRLSDFLMARPHDIYGMTVDG
jgi:hypothetical protein